MRGVVEVRDGTWAKASPLTWAGWSFWEGFLEEATVYRSRRGSSLCRGLCREESWVCAGRSRAEAWQVSGAPYEVWT